MEKVDLNFIEEELKKRWYFNYEWGRKQNDVWDRHSNFIYEVPTWEEVRGKAEKISTDFFIDKKEFFNYCSNRWYNFWSATAVEHIFTGLEGVKPIADFRDRRKDFMFLGIAFDHKTSVFPRSCGMKLSHAQEYPEELILWLYNNQSSQKRMHFFNRLFLIVYSRKGQHWKIKAEISFLKELIEKYVATFEVSQLTKLEFQPGKPVFSDIIWAIK